MANDYDPAGLNEVKKEIFEEIDPVLEKQGFDKARSGSETPLREFNNSNGFWEKGILSKPPRWLFHLIQSGGEWKAKLPDQDGNDRIGYYNLSNRDNVAALASRLLPVVKQGESWVPYEQWEWLAMVFLPEPANGTAAQDVNGFTPPKFDLECRGRKLNPIAIHVYGLCDPNSTCSAVSDNLTYEEATDALRQLFGVSTSQKDDSSDGV